MSTTQEKKLEDLCAFISADLDRLMAMIRASDAPLPPMTHLAKCGVCDWRQDVGSAEEADRVLERHMEEEHGEGQKRWNKTVDASIPSLTPIEGSRITLSREDYGLKCDECGKWFKVKCPKCHPDAPVCYGAEAPKPKSLRPWTSDEAIGKVVRVKPCELTRRIIVAVGITSCLIGGLEGEVSYKDLLEYYEQPDGSPCGVEVKE